MLLFIGFQMQIKIMFCFLSHKVQDLRFQFNYVIIICFFNWTHCYSIKYFRMWIEPFEYFWMWNNHKKAVYHDFQRGHFSHLWSRQWHVCVSFPHDRKLLNYIPSHLLNKTFFWLFIKTIRICFARSCVKQMPNFTNEF